MKVLRNFFQSHEKQLMNFMCDETYTYFNEMLFHERKIVILILINECKEEKKTVIESKHAAKSNRYFEKQLK